MIAPIKRPQATPSSPVVRHARRLVASALLAQPARPPETAPPVPVWRAWLFTAWVVAVVSSYFAHMIGWF